MKEFYHFGSGVKISNGKILSWMQQVISEIESGETHSSISSGDTSVVAIRWPTSIEVQVANSSGRSTINFFDGDDTSVFAPYVRPSS